MFALPGATERSTRESVCVMHRMIFRMLTAAALREDLEKTEKRTRAYGNVVHHLKDILFTENLEDQKKKTGGKAAALLRQGSFGRFDVLQIRDGI